MTPDQAKDLAEEIAEWNLDDRRAFIVNLAIHNKEDAEQVKQGLTELWARKG